MTFYSMELIDPIIDEYTDRVRGLREEYNEKLYDVVEEIYLVLEDKGLVKDTMDKDYIYDNLVSVS